MDSQKIIVIIPTFNEINNLPILINLIVEQNIPDLTILIVDDNSPDGTADCARDLSRTYDDLICVLGIPTKQGLANAYKKGFAWALSKGYDVLVQMDGDLSHNPGYMKPMINKLDSYDVVIGSRYIEKGKISDKWSFLRKGISSFGNFTIRNILLVPVRDITSGFKVFNHQAAKAINWNKIYCTGFGFQSEVTFQCHKLGYSIFEMPILFEDRLHGKSKMTFRILLETIVKIIIIRLFRFSKV